MAWSARQCWGLVFSIGALYHRSRDGAQHPAGLPSVAIEVSGSIIGGGPGFRCAASGLSSHMKLGLSGYAMKPLTRPTDYRRPVARMKRSGIRECHQPSTTDLDCDRRKSRGTLRFIAATDIVGRVRRVFCGVPWGFALVTARRTPISAHVTTCTGRNRTNRS